MRTMQLFSKEEVETLCFWSFFAGLVLGSMISLVTTLVMNLLS
jgi:hypothetical protein